MQLYSRVVVAVGVGIALFEVNLIVEREKKSCSFVLLVNRVDHGRLCLSIYD